MQVIFASSLDADKAKLKKAFLNAPLLKQFKDNLDKLELSIPEKGCVRLHLTNFKGLNTSDLQQGSFNRLKLDTVNISNGHIYSGGPEGISVQFAYDLE